MRQRWLSRILIGDTDKTTTNQDPMTWADTKQHNLLLHTNNQAEIDTTITTITTKTSTTTTSNHFRAHFKGLSYKPLVIVTYGDR